MHTTNRRGLTMTKIKQSKYTNSNPPINDRDWQYHKFNDVLARFKALGWIPPTEKKGNK